MRFAALLIALVALSHPSAAQPVLSDQRIHRPIIGLTASLPVGASMSTYQIAGRGANRIILPGSVALVNVTDVVMTKSQTLAEVADSIIRQRLDSVSSLQVDPNLPNDRSLDARNARGRLLERGEKTINGSQAEVFYLQVADVGNEDSAFGYALFMPNANAVAMFELQTPASSLAQAKPYFELMIGSVHIADPAAAEARRALGVEGGLALFQSLSPADYEAVISRFGADWRYERLYRPAPNGSDRDAAELGYRRTRLALGTRADLKSRAERGNVTPEDRQQGYLVFQEARILDGDRVIDVAASFFMTPDRRHEGWSIRQSIKPAPGKRGATSNTVETGIRDRDDMTIARSVDGKPVSTVNPAIQGAGYISRAEVYLLPYLLMGGESVGDFRFYAYNQALDRIALRQDVLEADPDHAGDWKYVSRPSEDAPGQTAYFTAKGELVRAELPDNQVWEPIGLKRLFELWSSKGLPTQ